MEVLERLTRRQIDALAAVVASDVAATGGSLNRIAGRLKVRPPSALTHLTVLEREGLVRRHRGKTSVTDRGRACLAEYQRHHRIAEGLFAQIGLSRAEVCSAAREIDLALTHRTVERLCRAEGHPPACPHGAPIPPCEERPGAD
jgi:Mn-dependent DtxR family transcriptional regulator